MTQYSDLPAVNALYLENEQVNNAIAMIDAGGSLTSFAIAPPPVGPDNPTGMMIMGATIAVGPPNDPALMDALRNWLVNRSNQILAELSNYDVTEPPPSKAASEGRRE